MDEAQGRKTAIHVFPAGPEIEALADAEPGEGIERVVDFQPHGEGAGCIFQRIAQQGSSGAGPRPDAPAVRAHAESRSFGGVGREEKENCGGERDSGQRKKESGSSRPESDATQKARQNKKSFCSVIGPRGRGPAKLAEEQRQPAEKGGHDLDGMMIGAQRMEIPEQQRSRCQSAQGGFPQSGSAAQPEEQRGKCQKPRQGHEQAAG